MKFHEIKEGTQRQETLAVIKNLQRVLALAKSRKKQDYGLINRTQGSIRYLKQQVDLLRKDSTMDPTPLQYRVGGRWNDQEGWKHGAESDPESEMREKTIELIKKNCKPFLEAIDYDILKYKMFRGYTNSNAATISTKIRLDNRKPADMTIELHNLSNDYFQKNLGEPFRNAMFVTGFKDHASKYGTTFLIFPVGEFTFAWSPRVKDLFEAISGNGWRFKHDLPADEFNTWMDTKIFQNTDLKAAIKSRNEIMIRGPGYYGINLDYWLNKPVYAKFMRQIAKRFK